MLEITHILNVSTPAYNGLIEKGKHTYPANSEWVLAPSIASLSHANLTAAGQRA